MFTIITQLQLPQSCRHSNGAGRPSRAAKWQEGVWALWAGQRGGGPSSRHSPTGSLCWLPHPPAPSQRQGEGALSGHREVGTAQGSLQQTSHSRSQGLWGKGEQVSRGLEMLGVPVVQGSTLGVLVPRLPMPQHGTPGSHHSIVVFPLRGERLVAGSSPGRVFMTPLTPPCQILLEPGVEQLGQD